MKYRLLEASSDLNNCSLALCPLKCFAKLEPDKGVVMISLQSSPLESFELREVGEAAVI